MQAMLLCFLKSREMRGPDIIICVQNVPREGK